MEDKNPIIPEEEEGIDVIALLKSLWEGKWTIVILTAAFMVLGLAAALSMQRKYTVSTVMVPQVDSGSKSSLSSLASLAGIDLSSASGSELSPLLYPQIVNSVPFMKELMYTPLHYNDVDTAVNMFTYTYQIAKPSLMGKVKKYTIGLPGVIMDAIRGEKPEVVMPAGSGGDDSSKPIALSNDEYKLIKSIGENVSLAVDKKEGYLTLTVTGTEPIQTTELAMKAQQLLQEEITRFRVEKSQNQLDYIQARYDEVKKETEAYQERLAVLTDRSQSMTNTRDRIEQDRIQSKYTISNSVYSELAKQLEQAKMQVKRDTPVFTVIKPVQVPNQPSNSRAKTLVVWTFLGAVLGCGIVLLRSYMPKLMEMFEKSGTEE